MKIDMVMPKLGESIAEATVIQWLKKPGDEVAVDEVVLEISTDKVDSEIPSPNSGYLSKILVQDGETVEVGTVIAELVTEKSELGGDGAEPVDSPDVVNSSDTVVDTAVVSSEEPAEAAPEIAGREEGKSDRFYSPLVRSIARKEGVAIEDLDNVEGTGAGGRVTKNDLLAFIDSLGDEPVVEAAPVEPEVRVVEVAEPEPVIEVPDQKKDEEPLAVAASSSDDEVIPMDRMRKAIADHMVRSIKTSPHVYTLSKVDMKNIVDFRSSVKKSFFKKENFNLTFTPFIVRAIARALKEFPYLNASVDGDNIILKKSINVGVAVALDKGLIVPVIRNADKLDLLGTAREVNDLSTKARDKKLLPDDVQGGTFSVTNMGVFGSIAGFPIINQPQVAILGVGTISKEPVVVNDAITIRPIMYLTIGFDHRVVDGADGAKFLERVASILSDFDPLTGI